jgi:tRNA modification GTPase
VTLVTDALATHVIRLTAPGRGAIASVRIEGPRAVEIVGRLLKLPRARRFQDARPNDVCYGRWQSAESGEEVVVFHRGPSYVEVHCHGGVAAVSAIVESLVQLGCQETDWRHWLAETGDDPIVAAAEIALAQAPTERTAVILWGQRRGALRDAIKSIRSLAANGDVARAIGVVERLLELAAVGLHLTRPWTVVLAGRPNVGKSSLINALVGYERAIVHDTPGTTRDVLSAATAIDGWPIELTDTAGLRQSGEALEAAGIELARERLAAADLAVLVFDASVPWSREDEMLAAAWPGALWVFNKCDLPQAVADELMADRVCVSATRGDGLDQLRRQIAGGLAPSPPRPGEAVPFLPEQAEALVAILGLLRSNQIEAAQGLLVGPPFTRAGQC